MKNIKSLWKACKIFTSKIYNFINKIVQNFTSKENKIPDNTTGKRPDVNFCKSTSKQVKILKQYFENDKNDSLKNDDLANNKLDGKNLLIEFLKFIDENSVNEKIPKASLIENHLGIRKPKRLELSNWAKEKDILIPMPDNSYKLNVNVDMSEIIEEIEKGE